MANTVYKREIQGRVHRMQQMGLDVGLDGAFGRYRVTDRDGKRSLSPRMPNRFILEWLDAYEQGWRVGHVDEETGLFT